MVTKAAKPLSRHNNFDLLRLFAALSVMANHMAQHGIVTAPWLAAAIGKVWHVFPGVPIFFIISGFLITGSWMSRQRWKPYLKARALRIFPALFVSTCATTGLLWWFGYTANARWDQLINWFLGTVTLIQPFHTPGPLKGFSGDMPNASVWTLPVEFEFYLLLPLLGLAFVRSRRWGTALLVAFAALSFLLVAFEDFGLEKVIKSPDPRHTIIHHFWWFGLGVAACWWWKDMKRWCEGKFLLWLAVHLAVFAGALWLPDRLAVLVTAVSLAGVTLAAAFTAPGLAHKWLNGEDLSYGIYLFHRPFIHASVLAGIVGWWGAGVVGAATFAAAMLSWLLVEKPALKLK